MKAYFSHIYLIMLLLLCGCTSNNNKAEKKSQEQPQVPQKTIRASIPLNGEFQHYVSVGRINAIYTQGTECSLQLEGDSMLISKVTVDVDSRMLTLGLRPEDDLHKFAKLPHVTAYISSPTMQYVSLCESGSFTSIGRWESTDVKFGAMGKGAFHIDTLCCSSLLYQSSGEDISTFKYIETPKAQLFGSSRCNSKFNISTEFLYVDLTGNSTMTISGTARHADFHCGNNAKIDNSGLK